MCGHLLMKTWKRSGKQSHEAVLRRNREAGQRWKRRQTRQRLAFVFVMSIVALHIHSPMRSVWSKERSSYWWEHIVGQTFTSYDWLENFRMSHATFM